MVPPFGEPLARALARAREGHWSARSPHTNAFARRLFARRDVGQCPRLIQAACARSVQSGMSLAAYHLAIANRYLAAVKARQCGHRAELTETAALGCVVSVGRVSKTGGVAISLEPSILRPCASTACAI